MTLALAGKATAATPKYKTGVFLGAGCKNLQCEANDGIELRIASGRFAVRWVSYKQGCSGPSGTFTEEFSFKGGAKPMASHLSGPISSDGSFAVTWDDPFGGFITVVGEVRGSRATVKSSEGATFFDKPRQEEVTCQGKRKFALTHRN